MPLLRRPEGPPDKRSLIFEAAIRVFSTRGYHGATMDEIASDAKVAKGTLYNYFENKAHLFTQLYQLVEQGIWEACERCRGTADDPALQMRKMFRLWCEAIAAFGAEGPLILEVWAASSCHPGEHDEVWKCLIATYDKTLSEMAADIERGVAAGSFKKDVDPRLAARSLTALFDGLLLQVLLRRELETLPALGEAAFDLFLRGLAGK